MLKIDPIFVKRSDSMAFVFNNSSISTIIYERVQFSNIFQNLNLNQYIII